MRKSLHVAVVLLGLLSVSCSSDYYVESDFNSVAKYDTHIHIYTNSDAISEQAAADNFQMINVCVDAAGNPPLPDQEKFSIHQTKVHPRQIQYITAFSV